MFKMELYFFCLVTLISILSASEAKNYTCDYQFGDPTWESAEEFFNRTLIFPSGAKNSTVDLPHEPGQMTSFVCVNVPGVNKNTTDVFFSAIFQRVTVVLLEKEASSEFPYHVAAKRHGY